MANLFRSCVVSGFLFSSQRNTIVMMVENEFYTERVKFDTSNLKNIYLSVKYLCEASKTKTYFWDSKRFYSIR